MSFLPKRHKEFLGLRRLLKNIKRLFTVYKLLEFTIY